MLNFILKFLWFSCFNYCKIRKKNSEYIDKRELKSLKNVRNVF